MSDPKPDDAFVTSAPSDSGRNDSPSLKEGDADAAKLAQMGYTQEVEEEFLDPLVDRGCIQLV